MQYSITELVFMETNHHGRLFFEISFKQKSICFKEGEVEKINDLEIKNL